MNELAALTLVAALCVHGVPAKRIPDVTYGGYRHALYRKPCLPGELCCPLGTVRDHVVPLCAGGPDTAANIQCQSYRDSKLKDGVERRACEQMCAGRITQPQAQEMSRHWRKYIHDESWWRRWLGFVPILGENR